MKYKTELHAHTSEVSRCAHICGEELVEIYEKAGYSTVVITDHMSKRTFPVVKKRKWNEYVDDYLIGYDAAKKAAQGRLNIILGMEISFYENDNDYLVYGVDEKFLRRHPNMMEMGIRKFSAVAKRSGLIVVQAHPFRDHMTVIKPGIVEGIEIFNAHPGHDSRNDIARMWAEKYGYKIRTSGSDFHEVQHGARGGIITDFEIKTNEDLLKTLRGDFERIITDDIES